MEKFNVSKEVEDILKECYREARDISSKEVPLSLVTYKILKKYLKGNGQENILKNYISKKVSSPIYTWEKINEILDNMACSVDEDLISLKNTAVNPFTKTKARAESIVGCSAMISAFRRSIIQNHHFFLKEDRDTIHTSSLFLAVLWDCGNWELLNYINSSLTINKTDYVSFLTTPRITTPLGRLETRILDFDNLEEEINNTNTNDNFQSKMENDENDKEFEEAGRSESVSSKSIDPESKTPYLDEFSYDISKAARAGKFDPVVGRTKELSQIIEILACRKKNNAMLLGDPGCGKTAIVEKLAQEIENGNVPPILKDKRVCSLDLNALVSGTKYRGEYEQRLQGIIKEVCANPEIIIYIDEAHNLIGNGGSSGNGDGANILKPYLARGEFQCIASTTVDEYRKFIEKDGALKRRFQNVMIDEPTENETIQILTSLSKKYGDHHQVRYPSEIIKACVEWSGRYIVDRFFPDKAIDILDMAGSLTKLKASVDKPKEENKVDILTAKLKDLEEKKLNAVINSRFDEATEIKGLIKTTEKELEGEKAKIGVYSEKDRKAWPEVTMTQVAEVISKISKVPVDKIQENDMTKLRDMKSGLEKKVIGQDSAVKTITVALQRNLLGLRDQNKPIASLLFVGPTGTGKTLICKEIAKEFFGSERALIKFDMAEFAERHSVSKLTGATASYVGYDDSPLLEQVRRQPYSVVLFDEIEKAAPEIYNIFLSILEESTVTLGNGTRVDFSNCIVIFTGNVGTKELSIHGKGLGFGSKSDEAEKKEQEKIVMKAVEKNFRPEFINRLSSITVFNELHKPELLKIFDLEFAKVKDRLKKSGYSVKVSSKVKNLCVESCDPKYGARDLQRAITRNIEEKICEEMLKETTDPAANKITVDINESNNVVVEITKSLPKKKDSKDTTVETSAAKEEVTEVKE